MKCNIIKSVKTCLIIALCVIVAGMVMFGIYGFNNAITSEKNYEVTVSVDQNVNGAGEKVKTTADAYFKEIGVKSFTVKTIDEGAGYIYVFTENKVDAEALEDKIQNAVGDSVVANCVVTEVNPSTSNQVIKLLIALGVASVAIMIYLLIVDKPAATFTVLLNAIFASVLFVATVALVRIPVFGAIEIYVLASFALSAVLTVVISGRIREIATLVGNEKLSSTEIAVKGVKDSKVRICAFALLTVVSGVALAAIFTPYLIYTAGYILISGLIAVFASIVGTIMFWPALKRKKKA